MDRKITDPNSSDSGVMEELTDEELLQINGGGFWRDIWGDIKKVLRGVIIPIFSRRF